MVWHRLILILSFLFLTTISSASVSFDATITSKNVKIGYHSNGGDISEFSTQVHMLLYMLRTFSKEVCFDTAYLFVDFDPDEDPLSYSIKFGAYDFQTFDKQSANIRHRAIKLSVGGHKIDYSGILKILYFVITNQEYISSLQNAHLQDTTYWYPYVLKPLINAKLKSVASIENPIIDHVLHKRHHRPPRYNSVAFDSINYYYQNGKFHVYKRRGTDTSVRKILGSFSNIEFILSDSHFHYLIAVNSFCFYHLALNDEKLSGPFYSLETLLLSYGYIESEENKIRISRYRNWGDLIFYPATGIVTLDTNSLDPDVRLKRRQQKQYKIEQFVNKVQAQIDFRKRQRNGVIIILISVLVNIYLARFKK